MVRERSQTQVSLSPGSRAAGISERRARAARLSSPEPPDDVAGGLVGVAVDALSVSSDGAGVAVVGDCGGEVGDAGEVVPALSEAPGVSGV